MAAHADLQIVHSPNWLAGFSNLVLNEFGRWWKTWRWITQILLWLVIVNGMMVFIIAGEAMTVEQILGGFLNMWGLILPIGVTILGQDAIIQERQSGTAAWILSKPTSRSAFILGKATGNALGVLVAITLVQGIAAYLQIWLSTGRAYPVLHYAGALGIAFLALLFYLTLTIALGTLFNSRGPVIGIPLALVLGSKLLKLGAGLSAIMPWNLTSSFGPEQPALAVAVAEGLPLPSVAPLIATIVWCLLFMALALWKFNRDEF